MSQPSLADRLRDAFLEDLEEQVGAMNTDLLSLEASPDDQNCLKSLFRAAHTIKGAARAAGLPLVEEACHALESRLADARSGAAPLVADDFAYLYGAADALESARRRLRAGEPLDGSPTAELLRRVGRGEVAATPPARAEAAPIPAPAPVVAPTPEPTPHPAATAPAPGAAGAGAAERSDTRVRVAAEQLDLLVDAAGELRLLQGRIDRGLAELGSAHEALTRTVRAALSAGPVADTQHARRVRAQLDAAERLQRDLARWSRGLGRLAGELTTEVGELRLRPFADAFQALPRIVRDVAQKTGKEVRLALAGEEVAADRAVLDAVRDALLHAVRNAVDHGIEHPDERERRGKPREGTLRVEARLHGQQVQVLVADDGRGLDLESIRATLRRLGRPVPDDAEELARLLFEGGVSTQTEVTTVSGRGVGLDAVREAVERVRGTVSVRWTEGRGTTFVMECPLSLAAARVVLASVGGDTYAVPSAAVQWVRRVRRESIRRLGGREMLTLDGEQVVVVALHRILGIARGPAGADPLTVMLLRVGDRRVALGVDGLLGEEETVIRRLQLGSQSLPHLAGAVLLETGGVALVLNAAAVLDSGLSLGGTGLAATAREERPPLRVLVVDDSITTRTLEQGMLQAAGYHVTTAVDGVDAWEKLQEHGADLVVSDVEMPRMTGLELCQAVRASPRFQNLPFVLVTSLEKAEDRAHGMEVGASAYVGKGAFDQAGLLEIIRTLVG